jgi:hypothetical protein
MHGAGKRLVNQAKSSGLFTKTLLITEEDLLNLNEDGLKLKLFADIYPRGFGLFSWKSYILNLAMQGFFGKFDGIFYADAGCELLWNKKSIVYFKDLMDKAEALGILTFTTPIPELFYTKKDVLALLDNPDHVYSPQIEATVIFAIPHSNSAVELIAKWWEYSSLDEFKYLLNPNPEGERKEFIEHRWDQSILSVLLKNAGYETHPESTPRYSSNSKHISYLHYLVFTPWPIWSIRNRTGSTKLKLWQKSGWLSLALDPMYSNRFFVFRFYKYLIHIRFAVFRRLQRFTAYLKVILNPVQPK